MAYFKETVRYGKYVDVKIYHTLRQYEALPEKRRPKFRETAIPQQEANRRRAIEKLMRLICCNFTQGDLHVQLKYIRKKDEPYRTAEEMRRDIAVFHRKIRAEYRKKGIEYKYIHVMEIGKRGARHHHMVMNYIDPRIIQKHWPFARVTFTPLDGGDYRKLAAYLVKQSDEIFRNKELMKQRYNCSKNLKKPQVKREKIKRAATYARHIRVPKGYMLLKGSDETGADFFGHIFFKYTLVKLE